MKRVFCCVLVAGATVLSIRAEALDILVPGDVPSIQAAIDLAAPGDRVLVAAGVYAEQINFSGKNIVVQSQAGAETTVIDGGDELGYVVTFAAGESRDAILRGFTVTGGFGEAGSLGAGPGGGIRVHGSAPTIEAVRVIANLGGLGGGLSSTDGDALVRDSVFEDNQALQGAGMWIETGAVTLDNVRLMHNRASTLGGGIALWGAQATIQDSRFEGNVASSLGGAVYGVHPQLSVARTDFIGNGEVEPGDDGVSWVLRTLGGGALYVSGGQGRIEAGRFVGNVAAFGTAVYFAGGDVGSLEFVNNLVAGNAIECQCGIGALYFNSSSPRVVNATVVDNGGMAALFTTYNAFPSVQNSIIAGHGVSAAGNGSAQLSYTLFDVAPFAAAIGPGSVLGDPMLDAGADYAPLPGSPVIDAGDNDAVPSGVDTDLIGLSRFVDDPSTPDTGNGVAPLVDLGAIEFQTGADSGGAMNPALGDRPAPHLLLGGLSASPNPFARQTRIRFELRQAADVRVEVLDRDGHAVHLLHAGAAAAGMHEMSWDGSAGRKGRLAPGDYMIVVHAGRERRELLLTLLR